MLTDGGGEGYDRAPGVVIGPLELVVRIVPGEPKLLDRGTHTSALWFERGSPWQGPESTQSFLAVHDVRRGSNVLLGFAGTARVIDERRLLQVGGRQIGSGLVQPEKPLAAILAATGEVLAGEHENSTDDGAEQ
jgi:hypothetical protein